MNLANNKFKIFSLSSNPELSSEIAKLIGTNLSSVSVNRFSDGEVSILLNETVRGHDVFVIQSTNSPVNDNLMELLIMCDALKRASAKSINIVIPYFGYQRQDRIAKPREPITAKLVADLLQCAGASRVLCMDLHAAQIQGFFNIPIDNFFALPILVNYFIEKNFNKDDLVVVSPDHGGLIRARRFAKILGCKMAIIDKRRPAPNQAEVMNILGEVKNKICIIVDDIIDTAGTLCVCAKKLHDEGANDIFACVTHGVLSGPAIKLLSDSFIKKIIITNTIKLPDEKKINNIEILSVASLFAEGIKRILNDEPISLLFKHDME